MNYLGKHNAVAVQKLKKDVTLLIITQSELTYQLGLSRPHQYPVLLYCLFLSRTSARKRLSNTTGFCKETQKSKFSPAKQQQPTMSPLPSPAKQPQPTMSPSLPSPAKQPQPTMSPSLPGSDDPLRTPQSFSTPFLPPSSPHHSIPPSPKRDYQISPSSNIVSWPQNVQFGSPRNLPVPHSTPPQSPAAHGGAPVPHTPPYRMPQSPQMTHSGHSPFHGLEFGTSPQRRLSRDGQHGFPYPPESKSGTSFNPPNTFPVGPNFDPQYQPRPSFSPRSPYQHPSYTGDPRFQNPVPHFGNNSGYGGHRFPDPNWNSMQSPAFPERFDPNRSPRMPGSAFENSGPSDHKFNTLPHFKMQNISNDAFNSPTKPSWSQGSPYRGSPSGRANFNLNVQTTLHRSDPRLSKNVSPKVNPVAPMPRGSTTDTHGSPSQGMVSPVAVEFSSSKMSPVSLPSPQQVPVVSLPGTPPQHQVHPVLPSQAVSLPEPPKLSRVDTASIVYDSGFFFKPPSSSLMQYDKVKKVFEEQNVVLEIQQRAKEAIKRHLLARSRSESKKTQSSEAEKHGNKQSGKESEKEVVESAEDMKQLLESNLESKFSAKKKFETIRKKNRVKHELKEKHRMKEKEKHFGERHRVKGKHHDSMQKDGAIKQKDGVIKQKDDAIKQKDDATKLKDGATKQKDDAIKQKDGVTESLLKLKIPIPEAFKLDSLEDIARMRKITEEEIKKESERQHMDDLELEEDVVEEVTKKSKKRPKERDSVDEESDLTDSDEALSKKAKIDTASDMKDFLNFSLEENNSSSELTPLRTELIPKRKLEKKRRSEGKLEGDKQSQTEFYNICDEIHVGGVVGEIPKADNVGDGERSTKTVKTHRSSLNAECDSDKRNSGLKVGGSGMDKKLSDKAKGSQFRKNTPTTDAVPKDKKSIISESEKMETEISDQSGRWDNPMKKKKRQDSESDGERKIENQKGKIIIIKEIRMIRVNSDGSEIKSPDKEVDSRGLLLESPVSPVQVPLEEIPETVEIKLEDQEEKVKEEFHKNEKGSSKRKEKDVRKADVYSKRKERDERRDDDVKKKTKDECKEKTKRKDEGKVKERTSESKGKGKSVDCRKHLVYYSDTESESSRSQSSSRRSRRSETPKSDDDLDSVPRYTKIYPDFKPGRNPSLLPKAATSSSQSRLERERKPGDQRRGLHHKAKHRHDSKTFSYKSGKAGVSKLTGVQVKTKVKSLVQSRKEFKAQQAIIEGIITSSNIPLKKIPKIQKQTTNSTSAPRHKSSSLHSSGDSKEGFPEQLRKPSPQRESNIGFPEQPRKPSPQRESNIGFPEQPRKPSPQREFNEGLPVRLQLSKPSPQRESNVGFPEQLRKPSPQRESNVGFPEQPRKPSPQREFNEGLPVRLQLSKPSPQRESNVGFPEQLRKPSPQRESNVGFPEQPRKPSPQREFNEGLPVRLELSKPSSQRERGREESRHTQTIKHCTESRVHPLDIDGEELVECADPRNVKLDKPSYLQVCESTPIKDAQNQQDKSDDHSKVQPDVPKKASSKAQPDIPKVTSSKAQPDVPKKASSKAHPDIVKEASSKALPDVPKVASAKAQPDVPKEAWSKTQPDVPKEAWSKTQPDVPKEAWSKTQPDVPKEAWSKTQPDIPKEAASKAQPDIPREALSEAQPDIPKEALSKAQPDIPKEALSKAQLDVHKEAMSKAQPDIHREALSKAQPDIPKEALSKTQLDVPQKASSKAQPDVHKEATSKAQPDIHREALSKAQPDISKEALSKAQLDVPQKASSKAQPDIPKEASSFGGKVTVLSEIPVENILVAGSESDLSNFVMATDDKTVAASRSSSSERSTETVNEVLMSSVKREKETTLESQKHITEEQPPPIGKKNLPNAVIKTPSMSSKTSTVKKLSTKINDDLYSVISSFISKQKGNACGRLDKKYPNYVKEKQKISVYNALQRITQKDAINDEENASNRDQNTAIMDDFVDLENGRDLRQVEETLTSRTVENDISHKTDFSLTTVENDISCKTDFSLTTVENGISRKTDFSSTAVENDISHKTDFSSTAVENDISRKTDFSSTAVENDISRKTDFSSTAVENDILSETDSSMETHSLQVEKSASAQASDSTDYMEDENSFSAVSPNAPCTKLREEDSHTKEKEKIEELKSPQLAMLRRCHNKFCDTFLLGKSTGQWNDELRTGIEDEFEPDSDRVVQALTNKLDLKITVANDMSVFAKFSWISKEQLIRDCIHGKTRDPMSSSDVSLVVSVNNVIHKISPQKVHQRTVSVDEESEDSGSVDHQMENGEDLSPDEYMYSLEEEPFPLEKSPNISNLEGEADSSPLKQMQNVKDSENLKSVLPEVERLVNLVKVQLEDSNDETSVSSLSSSQNSFKSLSASQNSHDMFEKALSAQLNSISQGLDLLIQSNSNPLSFITPDEGKELNNIIDITMKSLQATMHDQNTDSGNKENSESEAAEENLGNQEGQVPVKLMPDFDSVMKTEFTASQDQPAEEPSYNGDSAASKTVAGCETDAIAFWSNILGFCTQEVKTLPLFINSPKEKDERSKISPNNEFHENGSIMVDNLDENEVNRRLETESCELDNEDYDSEQILKMSASEQDGVDGEEPAASVTAQENAMETGQDRKVFISPIRFPKPAGFLFGQIEKENKENESGLAGSVKDILDDDNTKVSSVAEKRTKIKRVGDATTEGPEIKVEPTSEECNREFKIVKQLTRNVEKEKTQPLNLAGTNTESYVKGEMSPPRASKPTKIVSQQEKTLTVLLPETKQKVTSQRLSPTLSAMTDKKGSGNSPLMNNEMEKEGNIKTGTIQPSTTKSRQENVFSRLSPLVMEDVKVEREVSPVDDDVRIIQLSDPIRDTRIGESVTAEMPAGSGEKQTKYDDVVIIINNERPKSNQSKAKSPKVQVYRPPPSSANAEPLSQVGPIRNKQKTKREERQFHPYRKEKKAKSNSWSFDINYNSLRDLMHDLTVCSYKSQQHKKKHCRTNSRFANYTFTRSKVPDSLPGGISNADEEEIDEEFNENAIPDFEERKKKADMVDELTLAEQEDEDYATERDVYVMEEPEQPKETDSVKTEEPAKNVIPRMLAALPVRTTTLSSHILGHKFSHEKTEIKTEPESKEEKSSDTPASAFKVEGSTGIKKEEQMERASIGESSVVDEDEKMEVDEPIRMENTEQVSNNDGLSVVPVNSAMPKTETDAIKTESSEPEKMRVEFLNSSTDSQNGDGETEMEGFSDWIVIDEAPEEFSVASSCHDNIDFESADSTQGSGSSSRRGSNVQLESIVVCDDNSNREFNPTPSVNDIAEVEKDKDVYQWESDNCKDITDDVEEDVLSDSDVLFDKSCKNQSVSTILDRTSLAVQDTSLSEEDGTSDPREGTTGQFIPVVHLMGVKGNTFWHENESSKSNDKVSKKDMYTDIEENENSVCESRKTADTGSHSCREEFRKSDDSEKSQEETKICQENHLPDTENENSVGGAEDHDGYGSSLSETKGSLQMSEEEEENEEKEETSSVDEEKEETSSVDEEKEVSASSPSPVMPTGGQSNSVGDGMPISVYDAHSADDLEKKPHLGSSVEVTTDLVNDTGDYQDDSHPCYDGNIADNEEKRYLTDDPDSEIMSVETSGSLSEMRDPDFSLDGLVMRDPDSSLDGPVSEDQDSSLSEGEGTSRLPERTIECIKGEGTLRLPEKTIEFIKGEGTSGLSERMIEFIKGEGTSGLPEGTIEFIKGEGTSRLPERTIEFIKGEGTLGIQEGTIEFIKGEGTSRLTERTIEFIPANHSTGVEGSTFCVDGKTIEKLDEMEDLIKIGEDKNGDGLITEIESALCAEKCRDDSLNSIHEMQNFPDDIHYENRETERSDKCKEIALGEDDTKEASSQLRAVAGSHQNPAYQIENSDSNPAAETGVNDLLSTCISISNEADADVTEHVMNSSNDVKVDLVSVSTTENGEGLSLLIGAYENSEGESFNSSTDFPPEQNISHDNARQFGDYHTVVGNDDGKETVKLINPQENSFRGDVQLSAINQSDLNHSPISEMNTEAIDREKEHADHKSDAVFADDKRKVVYDVENPRDADGDGSFDTEQRLEDIMSVIGESDILETYSGVRVEKLGQMMSKIPDECDLCDDQLCLAKVKCLTDALDPLEEAMLSSGILDVNDIPMGNVIEICTDENCLKSTDIMQMDSGKMSCEKEETKDCLSLKLPETEGTGKYQRKCLDVTETRACKPTTNISECKAFTVSPEVVNLTSCKDSHRCLTFNPEVVNLTSCKDSHRCLTFNPEVEHVLDYGVSSGDDADDDADDSSSTETDYISDSLDSDNETSTRGDDMTKLVVSEYLQSNRISYVVDSQSRIQHTIEEVEDGSLHSSHSENNKETILRGMLENANDIQYNDIQYTPQTIENLENNRKTVTRSLKEKNQSVVKPLVAENKNYPHPSTVNSPPAMYSVAPLSQQMESNIAICSPQCTMIPSGQVPLNSLPQLYSQTQFQPFSNSTYSALPLLLPYLHFPVVPQIGPLLPLQSLSIMSSSHTFELTNDKFEAFRRKNNFGRSECQYLSPVHGGMPGPCRNLNIPHSPTGICSSATPIPRANLDYLNRNLTPERPGKKTDHVRTSPAFLRSNKQSPLLPPISSFRQRRIPDVNYNENIFSLHNSSPWTKNVAVSQLDHQQTRFPHQCSTFNSIVSTHNLSRDSLQKARTPTASVSPLDMTVQSKCNSGLQNLNTTKYKEGHQEKLEGKNLTLERQTASGDKQLEGFHQGHDLVQQCSVARRDRCSSGKIPVGHVKPMSFNDTSHKDNQTH
ncbi:uncharacterized protein LOC125656744 isoform X2 [Ostrea edulis]|nr:uncharacterized protein LOC125656744 isoform X2 [Ostrea edulis]